MEVDEDGDERPVLFDGTTQNFAGLEERGDGWAISVFPIAYSEWIACHSEEFTEAYERTVGEIPYAGIGVNTVAETSDGSYVLTRRDTDTLVYPGTLFTLGGGLSPGDNLGERLMREIEEEAGLVAGEHYDEDDLTVTALGSDIHYMGGRHERPEVNAHVTLNVPFGKVQELQGGTDYQQDVANVTPMSKEPRCFKDFLTSKAEEGEIIPSSEMSLTYAWLSSRAEEVGEEQAAAEAEELMGELNEFGPHDYESLRL